MTGFNTKFQVFVTFDIRIYLKTIHSCKVGLQVSEIAVFRMHVTSVVLAHRSKMRIACIVRM